MNRLKLGIVSCGFLGCAPAAPGTFGTLGGVALAWVLAPSPHFAWLVLLAAALVYAVGRSLGDWAEEYAAGKDPGFFVLDEVVGYLITIWWFQGPSLMALALGFLYFRLFDIVKPPGARWIDRKLGGADGILLDDVVAGLYALAAMTATRYALVPFGLELSTWTVGG